VSRGSKPGPWIQGAIAALQVNRSSRVRLEVVRLGDLTAHTPWGATPEAGPDGDQLGRWGHQPWRSPPLTGLHLLKQAESWSWLRDVHPAEALPAWFGVAESAMARRWTKAYLVESREWLFGLSPDSLGFDPLAFLNGLPTR